MREAERHRYGLAATADHGRPGCAPNSPVPSHPRSVTLPYSEVHVIDRPSGLMAYFTIQVFQRDSHGVTLGEKGYRTELYERTAERFGVGTKSGGIDAACEFSTQMLRNLERAAEHPDMTEELADVLSTRTVDVEYCIETGIKID